ncbi:hypothetical protein FGO68_gene17019 [Halteria grandinella]|uniref:Uncharacterized protein n=1 Tax=Halteria grandinella TaxID=5974 RepID=A0A8J8NWE8_HALGN|nr:hypothetical protein FGO68_gene17019 [Halteria grandinella]
METISDTLDVVKYLELEQIPLSQQAFIEDIQEYIELTKKELERQGKKECIETFEKGANELKSFIMGKWEEVRVWKSVGAYQKAGYCYSIEQAFSNPIFYFFLDGVSKKKIKENPLLESYTINTQSQKYSHSLKICTS